MLPTILLGIGLTIPPPVPDVYGGRLAAHQKRFDQLVAGHIRKCEEHLADFKADGTMSPKFIASLERHIAKLKEPGPQTPEEALAILKKNTNLSPKTLEVIERVIKEQKKKTP